MTKIFSLSNLSMSDWPTGSVGTCRGIISTHEEVYGESSKFLGIDIREIPDNLDHQLSKLSLFGHKKIPNNCSFRVGPLNPAAGQCGCCLQMMSKIGRSQFSKYFKKLDFFQEHGQGKHTHTT